jgi:hypothetical protein
VPSHSGAPYFFIRFFHRRRILGEPVKQNAHPRFVEEIQNAVSSLSQPDPHFPQLTFDLRGVRVIQRRPVLGQQIDPRQDLPPNGFWQAIESCLNRSATALLLEEFNLLTLHEWPSTSRHSLSYLISFRLKATTRDKQVGFPSAMRPLSFKSADLGHQVRYSL